MPNVCRCCCTHGRADMRGRRKQRGAGAWCDIEGVGSRGAAGVVAVARRAQLEHDRRGPRRITTPSHRPCLCRPRRSRRQRRRAPSERAAESRREGSSTSPQSATVARHLNLCCAGLPRRRRRYALGPVQAGCERRSGGWRASAQCRPSCTPAGLHAGRPSRRQMAGQMPEVGPVAIVLLT